MRIMPPPAGSTASMTIVVGVTSRCRFREGVILLTGMGEKMGSLRVKQVVFAHFLLFL